MFYSNTVLKDHGAIVRSARAGETLFVQGEPCANLFELRRGIVRVIEFTAEGDRQIMGFFFPGDFLGLPLAKHHRFSAEAASDLLYVSHCSLSWLSGLVRSREDEERFLAAVCQEERTFMQRGLIMGRVGALARMAAFLVDVIPHLSGTDDVLDFAISQTDIASYLATSPETVCRSLRQLREMRIIAMPRKDRMILQDRELLMLVAEGSHCQQS